MLRYFYLFFDKYQTPGKMTNFLLLVMTLTSTGSDFFSTFIELTSKISTSFAGAQEWRYRRCQTTPNRRWELSQESQAGRNNFHNTEVKISYKSDLHTLLCLLKIQLS